MPLVARLMLSLWLGFLVFIILRLQSGEETSPFRFVSWNEFIHDMLSKGEVSALTLLPPPPHPDYFGFT